MDHEVHGRFRIRQYSTDQHEEIFLQGCFTSNLFPGTFQSLASCRWAETLCVRYTQSSLGWLHAYLVYQSSIFFSRVYFCRLQTQYLYLLDHTLNHCQGSCTGSSSKWAMLAGTSVAPGFQVWWVMMSFPMFPPTTEKPTTMHELKKLQNWSTLLVSPENDARILFMVYSCVNTKK